MVLRLPTTTSIVPIIVLAAAAAALFRVYDAPERIQKRLMTAKEVCGKSGGQWTVDENRAPICKRD